VDAFQGRTADRIIAAMPADNARLTTQQAFYVTIGRARDRADLVTGDARKLADQLEKATGERVAALDGVAPQAAHETVFGVGDRAKREPDHAPRASEAAERGREGPSERGRGAGPRYDPGRDRDGSLPEPGTGRHQGGRDSGRNARPRPKSRWSRRRSRSNWTSACRRAAPSRAWNRPSPTANPGAHRSGIARRRHHVGQDHPAGMRQQGRRPSLSCPRPAPVPERLRPAAHATGESSPQFQHVK